MRTNIKKSNLTATTHEGARTITLKPAAMLRRTVMANMLFEDSFYEDGVSAADRPADRIKELVPLVTFAEASQIAIDAREQMKLRHVPLLVVREMLRIHKGRQMGDLIARVIQRPDELGELLALYWAENPDAPLTAQLKIGLARALKQFNEYELAKYDRDGGVKLRDVLFLSHARSTTKEQGSLLARLSNKSFFPTHTKSAHFPVKETYELDEYRGLDTPDTWEVKLSAGGDKKETFERLLNERKLGALALLRNLRGMLEANVSEDLIRGALQNMKTERVLPFRFITAARHAPSLEDALETAMFKCLESTDKIAGVTALLIDHSGSMNEKISSKSEVLRFDTAVGLAMILREKAERVRIFTYSDCISELPPRRGFALAEAARGSMHWGGTMTGMSINAIYHHYKDLTRLIVLTDEQSADRPPQPAMGKGYIVNVATYKHGIGYGPWLTVDGWSEAILDFIRMHEAQGE